MECYVCRSTLKGNTDCCQICDFPVFFPVSRVPGNEQNPIRIAAERYLEEKIRDVRIYLMIYHYAVDHGDPVLEGMERVLLADGKGLRFDKIAWSDLDFKKLDGRDSIVLDIQVENGKQPVLEYQAAVKNPQIDTDWMLGVKLSKGLQVCFVLGNKKNHTTSAAFPLL